MVLNSIVNVKNAFITNMSQSKYTYILTKLQIKHRVTTYLVSRKTRGILLGNVRHFMNQQEILLRTQTLLTKEFELFYSVNFSSYPSQLILSFHCYIVRLFQPHCKSCLVLLLLLLWKFTSGNCENFISQAEWLLWWDIQTVVTL